MSDFLFVFKKFVRVLLKWNDGCLDFYFNYPFVLFSLSEKIQKIWDFPSFSFYYSQLIQIFFTIPINRSGYKYKKALVKEIKADASSHGFECVSVSYITDPGLDKGYRYFFWLYGMHVNNPDSKSPVYTIVYPLKPIFKVDKTFGSIGLIYPDYWRYSDDQVKISCLGEDSNLTDPMQGFTK